MFRKILIANRGEIALRIIRTCKRLGIKTVAIYSDPDLESKHVTSSDEAYRIGSGPPAESYLKLEKSFETARSEANTGFGHPELYVEKFLEEPRHIEVQILAGPRGRVVHLGERECSLQRRYQKILEETPSPALDTEKRKRLVSLALKLVRATGYQNAGTVEFVMSRDGKFRYLETNKRIQVEHLISEMVTGIDIVEQQLIMASEHRLDLSQNEIRFNGAALNCRINAEDPSRGFIPSPGRVDRFVPPGGPGVRVDSALYNGAFVPEYYDSLVAKVAVQGLDRTEVIGRMKVALTEMIVDGIKTTIPVHQTILEDRKFLQGNYHAQFLDSLLSGWKPQGEIAPDEIAAVFLAIRRKMVTAPTLNLQTSDRRSRWRSSLEEPNVGKRALYVEGL